MGLTGELSTIGLAEVFQNLSFNRLTGTLTVTDGERQARLRVDEGRIKAIAVKDRELDYLEVARLAAVAPEEVLDRAAEGKHRRTLKAFLAAAGGFDEGRYDEAVRSLVEDEILPIFGWRGGAFTFREGKLPARVFDKEQLGCGVDLDPQSVAMEAARRLDEWSTLEQHVPTDQDVLVPAECEVELELDETAVTLLELADGTRTVATVIDEARVKRHDALTSLARLLEFGRLMQATPEALRTLAGWARMAGEVHLAARRLEVALELDPQDLEAMQELVRLHERAAKKADAAAVYVRMADLQVERGDIESARDALDRAAVLAPGDLDIMERIFRFREGQGERTRALRAGESLAAALVAQELYEDALPLYERLLAEHEDNDGLREAFARCLIQLDDHAKAAQHLLFVADRVFDRGDYARAREAYRKVLTADPECAEAAARIEEIESGEARARQVRRTRRRVLVVGAVLATLFTWQFVREWRAQGALQDVEAVALSKLARDNGDRARAEVLRHYAEFCGTHPVTRSAGLAADTVQRLLDAEIVAIDAALKLVPKAQTTTDIEFSLGRAERQLERLGKITYPGEVQDAWAKARSRIVRKLDALKPS